MMAKPIVERAPKFSMKDFDFQKVEDIFHDYAEVDDKGRYLHWSVLKWRLPQNDAKRIWSLIKFKRTMQVKYLHITDDNEELFYYCIPHSMEAKLHKVIQIAGGSIASVAGNVASDNIQKKFLVSSLMMEEAITSAQLEGASTTREVAKKMLEDEREPIDEDERMIINNFLLLKHAEKMKNENLTLDLILDFHRIATLHTTENNVVPGEFRKDNDIHVRDYQGEVAHQPPCYKKIEERLFDLCEFANSDHSGTEEASPFIPPVIKAIILHFMIGFEHPFRDGNGRTARAIFYWFMLKHEYDLFKYVSISKLLKNDPKGYGLSYLYTEKDNNDLTYFIDFQLDIILAAFDELQDYLKVKTDEFYQVVELLDDSRFSGLNFVQKDIIKKATKEPGRIFTVKEVSNSYAISDNTARKNLNALVTEKLIYSLKDGRSTNYISSNNLIQRLSAKKIKKV